MRGTREASARTWLVGAVVAVLVVALTGCGAGRSVESYCAVMEKHKDRYLTAMDEVAATQNPLAGIVGLTTALGDLNRMWEEAAKVAPDDIQTDVEAVRDAWAAQREVAEKIASDPLGGLASALATGFEAAAATQRVDEYTAQHCPDVGGMFLASPDEPEPAQPTQEASAQPEAQPRLLDVAGWHPFGPFLRPWLSDDVGGIEGPADLYVPPGGVVTIDAQEILPEDEILSQEIGYGFDGGTAFVIVLARIRVPASGLQPESTIHRVLRVDPATPGRTDAWVDIDDPGLFSLRGSSQDGVALIARDPNPGEPETLAVDLSERRVLWRHDGWLRSGFGWADHAVLQTGRQHSDVDSRCFARGGEDIVTVLDVRSGDGVWESRNQEEDCAAPHLDFVLGSGHVVYQRDDRTGAREARSVVTGHAVALAHLIEGTDPLTTLAWGYADSAEGEGAFGGVSLGGSDLGVVDLETGETVYSLDRERADALRLRVASLYDGVMYVTTSDEQFMIDVRTGEELGAWTVHPVVPVGDYTLMSDDTLRMDAEDAI